MTGRSTPRSAACRATWRPDLGGRAAADPGGAAGAGRSQQLVQRQSRLCPGAGRATCCRRWPSRRRTPSGSGRVPAWARWPCCTRTVRRLAASSALFLQSGSFFTPELDPQERRFSRFGPVTRFVAELAQAVADPDPVPVAMTCGRLEENLANNRAMADTLRALAYGVSFREVADVHNFTAWRDALDPALTGADAGRWPMERRHEARAGPRRLGRLQRFVDRLRPLRPSGAGISVRAGPGRGLREQRHDLRRWPT